MTTLEGGIMLARVYKNNETFNQAAGPRIAVIMASEAKPGSCGVAIRSKDGKIAQKPSVDGPTATESHNRLAHQIVDQNLKEPIAAGGEAGWRASAAWRWRGASTQRGAGCDQSRP
jgi:hypothetical protein